MRDRGALRGSGDDDPNDRIPVSRAVDAQDQGPASAAAPAGSAARQRRPPCTRVRPTLILNTKEEAASAAPKTKISVDYGIGDQVKVLGGPFASFNGLVEELDFDRGRVKVGVSIFGRATPVELEFEQVERVK